MKRIVLLLVFVLSTLLLVDARSESRDAHSVYDLLTHLEAVHDLPATDRAAICVPDDAPHAFTASRRPAHLSLRIPHHRVQRAPRLSLRTKGNLLHAGDHQIYLYSEHPTPHAVLRSADYYVVELRRFLI